jgi:putative ABC transport system ATP-binding protein
MKAFCGCGAAICNFQDMDMTAQISIAQPGTVMPIVNAKAVSYSFDIDTAPKQVLFDIDFTLARGEFVILTGPSGSGKTTLLTLIGALRALQSGSLNVFGTELAGLDAKGQREIRRKTGFIFQDHNLFDALTAVQTLVLTMELAGRQVDKSTAREHAIALLATFGMAQYADSKPHALSAGQKQRVAIARALVNDPLLVLADEPTASLDAENAQQVIEILRHRVDTHGTGVLMVTHDNRTFQAADRIVNMIDGRMTLP